MKSPGALWVRDVLDYEQPAQVNQFQADQTHVWLDYVVEQSARFGDPIADVEQFKSEVFMQILIQREPAGHA